MGKETITELKQVVDEIIRNVVGNSSNYNLQEGKPSFIRNRLLPLGKLIRMIFLIGTKSNQREIYEAFGYEENTASSQALVRQRNKLNFTAFRDMLEEFIKKTEKFCAERYKGYRLLACDGSDLSLLLDPTDKETYVAQAGKTGFNLLHLNLLLDVLNGRFVKATITGKHKTSERDELIAMARELEEKEHTIIICDRGYEALRVIAELISMGVKFIIRIKDSQSKGIASEFRSEDGEFDHQYSKILTRVGEKTTGKRNCYKFIDADAKCTVLDDNKEFPIGVRIVRFELPNGEYECLATNLPKEEFPIEELRELYNKRWEIELRIRDLKYSVGLNMLHSRIKNSVKQEIFAKLMLFNFCSLAANSAEIKVEKKIQTET